MHVALASDRDLLEVRASISPEVAETNVGEVSFSGGTGTRSGTSSGPGSIGVYFTDITAGTVITIPYELTLPTSVSGARSHRITGKVHSSPRRIPLPTAVVDLATGVDVVENGRVSNDIDGDGDHEDVDGDGDFDVVDVQALFANHDEPVVASNPRLFDYNRDGEVSIQDVQILFNDL